jgi:hypothetical protein
LAINYYKIRCYAYLLSPSHAGNRGSIKSAKIIHQLLRRISSETILPSKEIANTIYFATSLGLRNVE